MRLVYMGTPGMAVPPLRALVDAGHEVATVVTGPPRRRGRGSATSPSPVGAAARDLGIPVVHDPDEILGTDADLGVVVAFGQMLRRRHLDALDMVNLHFSLLPRWRGAAPVERAILAGDTTTGVCLMQVDEGLDTGAVHRCVEVPIDGADAEELRSRLVAAGSELLVRSLDEGLGEPRPQPDQGVTYAAKISTAELELDWSTSAEQISRVVRVGGAWTTWRGDRFKVHRVVARPVAAGPERPDAPPGTVGADASVVCGDGLVGLVEVQPAGRRVMSASDWANGSAPAGERLGA